MLAIRMQRKGRKGQAFFRVIVQDSRLSPKSGKVVAYIGNYNPHSKEVNLDNEKVKHYLKNGAQPSDRVARLFRSQKIELPSWVKIEDTQDRTTRNPEKLRKNQPAEEAAPEEEAPAEDAPTEEAEKADDAPAKEEVAEESKEEAPAEEKADEKPADEEKA